MVGAIDRKFDLVEQARPTFLAVALKASVVHTVTYFVVGLLAATLLDYTRFFAESSLNVMMLPTQSPWVMAGPLFQPIRGLLFGLVFYLLRDSLFGKRHGWLIMWFLLVTVGIVSTFGPSPGSIEGMIYTVFPASVHLLVLPEVLLQSLLLSALLVYWVAHPEKKWFTRVMVAAFLVMLILPALGLLVGPSAA